MLVTNHIPCIGPELKPTKNRITRCLLHRSKLQSPGGHFLKQKILALGSKMGENGNGGWFCVHVFLFALCVWVQ